MKKGYRLLGMVLAIMVAVGCFAACDGMGAKKEMSYVGLRVNPEIELVVDGEGKVAAVNAVNEDGEVLLCTVDLIGKKVEVAAELFTNAAIELGYIAVTAKDAAVYVLTTGADAEYLKELEGKVTQKINDVFDKVGVFGQALLESKAEYAELAAEWGVSLEEAIVIDRVLELYPEMTVDEVKALDFKGRMQLIRDDAKNHGLVEQLRDEYEEAVEAIQEKYGEFFALAEQLKALEIQLKDETLADDVRAALQQEYDTKKAQYDALKAQYDAEIEEAKLTIQAQVDTVKAELERGAQELKAQFEAQLKLHKEAFEKFKDQIMEQIKNWREQYGELLS